MSEDPEEQKTGFRGKALRLLAAGALVIVGFIFATPSRKPNHLTVQVNHEVELRLETILSQTNPTYKYLPWQRRVYDAFPEMIQREILSEFWEPNHGVEISGMPPRPGIARFMFSPRMTSGTDRLDTAAYHAMTRALNEQNLYLQLQYDGGFASHPQIISCLYSESAAGTGVRFGLFGCDFNAIPLTVKDFELQIVENAISGQRKVRHRVRLPNPVYEPVEPLAGVQALPATVTHNGVSVTLRGLFTKAVKANELRKDKNGNSSYPDLQEGIFLRAAGTASDPYNSCALFGVSEPGKAAPTWEISEVKMAYGKRLVPFVSEGTSSIDWQSTAGVGQLFTFFDDFGVLRQPIKISASLMRCGHFSTEEQQTVQLAMPTTGTFTELQQTLNFWDGPVKVGIGNQVSIPGACAPTADKLVLQMKGVSAETVVSEAVLKAADGTSVSLENYGGRDCYTAVTRKGTWIYDFCNSRRDESPPFDLSKFTTMTLTVVSPKRMAQTFDFVATPVEAQVPAASKQ